MQQGKANSKAPLPTQWHCYPLVFIEITCKLPLHYPCHQAAGQTAHGGGTIPPYLFPRVLPIPTTGKGLQLGALHGGGGCTWRRRRLRTSTVAQGGGSWPEVIFSPNPKISPHIDFKSNLFLRGWPSIFVDLLLLCNDKMVNFHIWKIV